MRKVCFAASTTLIALWLAACLGGWPARQARAESVVSAWFDPAALTMEVFSDRAPLYRSDYNTDCVPETGVIRPAGFIPPAVAPVSELTVTGCAVSGSGGRFLNGYYKRDGTDLYASLSEPVKPIPNSSDAIRFYNNDSQSSNAYLITDFTRHLVPVRQADGQLRYNLSGYTAHHLRDKTGDLFNVDRDSISFSPNGRWLLASTFQGALRLDLQTRQLLLFDLPLNYSSGLAPQAQTAITNDGRYAIVASGALNRLRLFDLSDCPDFNQPSLDRRNCRNRNLFNLLPPKTGSHLSLQEVRFLNNYAFRVYRRETRSDGVVNSAHLFTAPGQSAAGIDYLALGDSYTAGNGAWDYRPGTDTRINSCKLSVHSYPYLIKQSLGLQSAESVACSGAITWDIANDDPAYPGQAKDLLKFSGRLLPPILQAFEPGLIPQKLFVSQHKPRVITVSIGGNDIGFGDKLLACVAPGTCYASYEDRLEAEAEIDSSYPKVLAAYAAVKSSASPGAAIYAIGYPQIAKVGGNCGLNVRLDAAELEFAARLIGYLNAMLRRASQAAGIDYIEVGEAFAGHRLCETVYSNTAMHGLTAGDDAPDLKILRGPFGGESFHPNQLGHRLYRQAVLNQTDNFAALAAGSTSLTSVAPQAALVSLAAAADTTPEPAPDLPKPSQGAPATGRPTARLSYQPELAADTAYRQQPYQINLSGASVAARPDTPFSLLLDDKVIGQASTDAAGALSHDLTLPDDIPTGYSTLKVTGPDITGQPTAYYRTVYVAASSTDADGDGQPDTADSCIWLEPIGDSDQDGQDDACDPVLQAVSTPVQPPEASGELPPPTDGSPPHEPTADKPPSSTTTPSTQQPAVRGMPNTTLPPGTPVSPDSSTSAPGSAGGSPKTLARTTTQSTESASPPDATSRAGSPESNIHLTRRWWLLAPVAAALVIVGYCYRKRRRPG